MKKSKIICLLLTLSMILSNLSGEELQAKRKLKSYSTTTYGWGLSQNTSHQKPGGSGPRGWKMKRADAFYVGKQSKKDKTIYLTFDCGYEGGYTKKILKTLKKHNVKATFFVTEPYIKEATKIVKMMKKQGHLVGNHTSTHPQMSKLSVKRLKREIRKTAKTMKRLTGYEMDPFLRPPEGNFSIRSVKVTQSLGYATIFWSLAYYDYDPANQPSVDYVVNRFKTYYHKGMIPLVHAVSRSNAKALPRIIKFMKKKGYRFASLDELYPIEGEEENTAGTRQQL
ncbi:MAG: polysaccharide deacetylase family protein [Eubacterium sp.]|nr:polysaccharide deacetylase family protein [Eubacterium sp.]